MDKLSTLNIVVYTIVIASGMLIIAGAIPDFNSAKTAIDLFKAVFWLVVGNLAFWNTLTLLINGKPWWGLYGE